MRVKDFQTAFLLQSPSLTLFVLEYQGSSVLHNISEGSTSMSILGDSLSPLQDYQVQVRSLVVPGEGSHYKGIPSEWTIPVTWTSKQGVASKH